MNGTRSQNDLLIKHMKKMLTDRHIDLEFWDILIIWLYLFVSAPACFNKSFYAYWYITYIDLAWKYSSGKTIVNFERFSPYLNLQNAAKCILYFYYLYFYLGQVFIQVHVQLCVKHVIP